MKPAERKHLADLGKYQLLEDAYDRGGPEFQKEMAPEQVKEAAGIRPQLQEDIYAAVTGYVSRYRRNPMKGEAD